MAQSAVDRLLIPVAMRPTTGAFGSFWETSFWVLNPNSFPVDNDLPIACFVEPCGTPRLLPGQMRFVDFGEPADNPGFVAHVQQPSDNVWFNLRTIDTSRQADTFGTQIPVVPERAFYQRSFYLVDVPTASRFRVMLRLYDIDARSDANVQIRAISLTGSVYGLAHVRLDPSPSTSNYPSNKPSYLHIQYLPSLIPGIPTSGTPSLYNLEITPESPGLKIWGFITVTHNDTQHVTTIVPN